MKKKHVCGALGQTEPGGTVDFCDLPQGHAGDHVGKYHGLRWSGSIKQTPRASKNTNKAMYITESGGNIRGN